MGKTTVVIGDVHSCIEELNELLNVISYNPYTIRLVFLGDLFDRGTDSLACVRKVMEMNAECVMGNHEAKHIKWHNNELKKILTGQPNLMRSMNDQEQDVNNQLTDDEFKWLSSLPTMIDLGDNFYAIHAGVEPYYSFEEQRPDKMLRVRYVNDEGKMVPLDNMLQPKGSYLWSERWSGRQSIIYGHNPRVDFKPRYNSYTNPVYDLPQPQSYCLGIDTGCCFGGYLTAAIRIDKTTWQMVNVKAKQAYSKLYREE